MHFARLSPKNLHISRCRFLLIVSLILSCAICIPLYFVFTKSYPKSYVYNDPRLRTIDLRTDSNERPLSLWKDEEFECLGWKSTFACDPYGLRDTVQDVSCDAPLPSVAGYCEIRNKTSGTIYRVMRSTCTSWMYYLLKDKVTCRSARQFTDFSIRAANSSVVAISSHTKSLETLIENACPKLKLTITQQMETDKVTIPSVMQYGIVIMAYPKVIAGVYAIVQTLKDLGCTLPVEIWYDAKEMSSNHSILRHLHQTHANIVIRSLHDPTVAGYNTKPYVIFHSVFDNILFLDSDNIPARDPTFLFHSKEFLKFGAIFWPDFWHPSTDSIFNIHSQSALWEILDMPFIEMFEQESGQLLINRRRHFLALNKLLFYAHSRPTLLSDYLLAPGDKDLFRLAWLNTSSPFYMIPYFIEVAGIYDPIEDFFCGIAMVQHDIQGKIIFLHRNQVKLNGRKDQKVVMTHLQSFQEKRTKASIQKYRLQFKGGRYGLHTCYHLNPVTSNGDKTQLGVNVSPYIALEKNAIEHSIRGRELLTKEEEDSLRIPEEEIIAEREKKANAEAKAEVEANANAEAEAEAEAEANAKEPPATQKKTHKTFIVSLSLLVIASIVIALYVWHRNEQHKLFSRISFCAQHLQFLFTKSQETQISAVLHDETTQPLKEKATNTQPKAKKSEHFL